ncbi:MAG: peptidoglycan-binding protein [Leptolyngbyaceae cyanobacterium SL_1_1]|nr:peptidoglycan-binding protein [Leptolyngbyaceae cyanobacterium SL_1_1]
MTLAPRLTVSKRHYCTFSQLWTQWLQLVALSAIASSLAVGAATAQSPAQPSDNNIEDASPTEATSATQRPTARPTLRLNSEGEPVAELQALLKLLGLYSGAVDGVYNEATQAAVIGFQQAASLSADGIVGPATWNRLLPSPPSVENPPDSAAATAGPENSAAIAAEAMPPNQATPRFDCPGSGGVSLRNPRIQRSFRAIACCHSLWCP